MSYQNILLEKQDKLAKVTINRPNQLNALNKDTIQELSDCFTDLENDVTIRCIILTGSGERLLWLVRTSKNLLVLTNLRVKN